MASKIKLRRWDVTEHLQTEKEIAAYLEAAAEADDPKLMAVALGDVARARNMSQLARDAGMTREGLYKALSGKSNPSFATIAKITKAMGLEITFRPAKVA